MTLDCAWFGKFGKWVNLHNYKTKLPYALIVYTCIGLHRLLELLFIEEGGEICGRWGQRDRRPPWRPRISGEEHSVGVSEITEVLPSTAPHRDPQSIDIGCKNSYFSAWSGFSGCCFFLSFSILGIDTPRYICETKSMSHSLSNMQ